MKRKKKPTKRKYQKRRKLPRKRKKGKRIPRKKGVTKRDVVYTVQELKDMAYTEYLYTKHWRAKRLLAIAIHGDKCEHCGEPFHAVHHCTYVRRGEEDLNDLLILCKSCHFSIHYKWRTLKKKNFMMYSPRIRDLTMLKIEKKKKSRLSQKGTYSKRKYKKSSKLGEKLLKL